ncbi:aspartate aminotransferase family protein [Halorussus pelagicus]|uniref:aspartate aminotransferase family protein n=1 Tax=Halorussus pelagicus TaxID=2505977 RepID=UPI000FFCBEB9|nr:aspartate aminotransferase family protein [Halorussus pelagicus]
MSGFVYSEKPIQIESGEGVHLYDDAGNEYLDFGASYGVAAVGHCHPEVVETVQSQVEKLTFVQASYPNSARDALYEKLAAVAPGNMGNVWLCNSGTEANEAAIKFARSATQNSKIVAAQRGFHGRTMGSLSATWKPKYKKPFEPLAEDFEFVPYGDDEALADAVDDDTAAVLLEPIQGEGGVNPAPEGYLQTAREVTEETNSALILDEIQTGLGRTGALWACEKRGIVPDILTSAKGLGGGLPIGATLCADWIAEDAGPHGSTFSGGPVVSAAADATLSVVAEQDLAANAAQVGDYLQSKLRGSELPIRTIRGEGLLLGAEVGRGANRVLKELAMHHGILALPAGRTVVRLLPPLTVSEVHADEVVAALESVLAEAKT